MRMKKGSKKKKELSEAVCIKCDEKGVDIGSHVCKPVFTISVRLGGKTIEATGDTMFEAMNKLPMPHKIVTKGVVTVGLGDKTREIMLMPSQLKRLFYPNALMYTAKRFSFLART
jgi:hypothetical protein